MSATTPTIPDSSQPLFTIQQVSERVNLSKHTLRFWERELEGVIVPLRTKGGQRRYGIEHLLLIEEIKKMKNQGLSLFDIKRRYSNDQNRVNNNNLKSLTIDQLADQIAEIVKSTLYHFFEEEFPKKP